MEVTLSKARKAYPDCSAVASKLHAQLYNAEEQLRAQQHQTSYLTHLTARTFPRGLHCLSMRLTTEYFALQPEQRKAEMAKRGFASPTLNLRAVHGSLAPRSGAGRRRARIARFPEAFQLMRLRLDLPWLRAVRRRRRIHFARRPLLFPLRTTILIPHARIHSHVSIIFWASLSTQKPPINPVADKTNPPIAHTPACRYNATPSRSLPLGNGSHSGAHRESRPSPRGRVGLPQPTCFVTGPAAPDRVVVHAKFPLPTTPTSVVSTTGGSPGPTCRKRCERDTKNALRAATATRAYACAGAGHRCTTHTASPAV
ncbi:hypothetical protein GW17_00027535 [Ensete ventricosum]|nr:hypothetical protein GW17_00027535 [Ensete ventricosum]